MASLERNGTPDTRARRLVLVVEDDPAILRGLTDNLTFEGYDVITAADGLTARNRPGLSRDAA